MPGRKEGNGRALILAQVARAARLDRTYLLLICLSAALAHLGMLMNSAPVIIGAMLISPLMGPIMGIGFGLAVFENKLLRRSLVTLVAGVALAIAVSALITFISPVRDVTSAIVARIRPNLLDLFVAISGGIAGAHATMRRSAIGIVGVAIATALIPPLSVVGFGAATARWDFAGGALLLFITNAAAIALMATATARFQGYGTFLTRRQTAIQTMAIFGALALLAVPLAFSLRTIVRESQARAGIHADLQDLAGVEARISNVDFDPAARPVRLNGVVIVPRFLPGLEAAWFERARARLDRPVDGHLLQLRGDNGEQALSEQRLRQQVAEDEAVDRSVERIAAAASAATGVPRERIVADSRSRSVLIPIDPSVDPDEPMARERAMSTLRAAFPDWSVRFAVPLSPPPGAAPQPSPDAASEARPG